MKNLPLNMLRKKPLKSLIVLSILTLAWMMTGCSLLRSSPTQVLPTIPALPIEIASSCDRVSSLESGTGKAVLSWMVVNIPKANDCADKHNAVVKAYNNMLKVINDFNTEHK